MPVLELRGIARRLRQHRGAARRRPRRAGGSILAVLGPNGAGKTTLLKVISGALRPTRGRVLMEGHDVTGASVDGCPRPGCA